MRDAAAVSSAGASSCVHRCHPDAQTLLKEEGERRRQCVGETPIESCLWIATGEQVARREMQTIERLAARLADRRAFDQHVDADQLANPRVAERVNSGAAQNGREAFRLRFPRGRRMRDAAVSAG
jgi:hypothetical protein